MKFKTTGTTAIIILAVIGTVLAVSFRPFAVEAAYRADNRQLNLAYEVTLAVVLENLALSIDKVLREEILSGQTYRLEQ